MWIIGVIAVVIIVFMIYSEIRKTFIKSNSKIRHNKTNEYNENINLDRISDLKIELIKAKQELSDIEKQISDFESDLQTKVDILNRSYSDSELSNLVSSGKFPADKVDEYRETRSVIAKYIKYASFMRSTLIQARDAAYGKVQSIQSQLDVEVCKVPIQKNNSVAKALFHSALVVVMAFAFIIGLSLCAVHSLKDNNSAARTSVNDNPDTIEVAPSPTARVSPTPTQIQTPSPSPSPSPSPTPTPEPHESRPSNAAVLWYASGYEWPCEFIVENNDYRDYCLLFVDAATNDYVQVMYVRGNSTATFSMPPGLFELRYACGFFTQWCCFWDQFLDDTAYGMSDDPFYFESNYESYTVWTVAFESYDPSMDSMDTSDIDMNDFFGN